MYDPKGSSLYQLLKAPERFQMHCGDHICTCKPTQSDTQPYSTHPTSLCTIDQVTYQYDQLCFCLRCERERKEKEKGEKGERDSLLTWCPLLGMSIRWHHTVNLCFVKMCASVCPFSCPLRYSSCVSHALLCFHRFQQALSRLSETGRHIDGLQRHRSRWGDMSHICVSVSWWVEKSRVSVSFLGSIF